MITRSCPPPEGGKASVGRSAALAGASVLASLFVAACGGGGDGPAPPPAPMTQVPASAAANDAALESFAFNLAPSDTSEPLMLDNVATLPTSETDEPVALP